MRKKHTENISYEKTNVQLERILASSDFVEGKKLTQFLRYEVEQTLNVQSGIVKQYTVGVEAFG
jgi:uncharacterized membrane protein